MSGACLKPALLGGSLAAVLDLLYAFAVYVPLDIAPARILQSIASGWFGKVAYELGASSVTIGLLTHLAILWVAALMFVNASEQWPKLIRSPWRYGAIFGLIVFAVMNGIIVPLSKATATAPSGWLLLGSLAAHAFLVGIPIALSAAWCVRTDRNRISANAAQA